MPVRNNKDGKLEYFRESPIMKRIDRLYDILNGEEKGVYWPTWGNAKRKKKKTKFRDTSGTSSKTSSSSASSHSRSCSPQECPECKDKECPNRYDDFIEEGEMEL